jgi:hypothetical protein
VDPKKSLNELSSDEAWIQIKPWLEKLLAEKKVIIFNLPPIIIRKGW